MKFAKITMNSDGVHHTIVVNDDDISHHVRGAALTVLPGEVPNLTVEFMRPDFKFEGVGVVNVAGGTGGLLDALGQIDPQELEEIMLEDADMSVGPAQSFLDALRKMLS